MPKPSPRRVLVAPLLFIVLSGCLDAENPTPAPTPDADPWVHTLTGPIPASLVRPDDLVLTPSWKVGDWFGVHVWTAQGAPDGRHYNVVVVEETPDAWILAPDDALAAKEEVVTDLPVVGRFSRDDLASTAYEAEFGLFDFPLFDNHTWERTVGIRDPTDWSLFEYEVIFRAVYAPSIDVPGVAHPGFLITGTLANGTVVVSTDFVPALGWYAHLAVFDPQVSAEDNAVLRAESMGHGSDWTGTYYVDEARMRILHLNVLAPEPDAVSPVPYASFEVTGGDVLHGFVGSFAFAGAHETLLVDPAGTTYEVQATHASPDGYGAEYGWFDYPPTQGTWHVVTVGAGVVAVGVVVLWEVDENAFKLPAAA